MIPLESRMIVRARPLPRVLRLSTALLCVLTWACREESTQPARPNSRLNLPFDEARTESRDDALARRDATLEWYGGEPSAEYLAARKLLAEQEARKWLTPAPQSKSKVEVLAEGV